MADNFITNPAAGGDTFAADDIGGVKWQRVKIGHGADGSATDVSSASPLPVDTELPAAAALSDATANPTAPMVGAAGMVWNGSAWVRRHSAGDSVSLDGVGAVGPELFDGSGTVLQRSVAGDGQAITGIAAAGGMLYNGSTFDRQRGNTEGTLLASAARTETASSSTQTNHNARGVRLNLVCTAVTSTPLLYLFMYGVDPASGQSCVTAQTVGVTPIVNTIMTWDICPGTTPAAMAYGGGTDSRYGAAAQPVPRSWIASVYHGNANSVTYSLSHQYIL